MNTLQRTKKFSLGFTLLELLVVISIIGILVAMAAVSYTTAQKKARDARRQSDLKSWAASLEQSYADNSSAYEADCEPSSTYLPGGEPIDPKNSGGYSYSQSCSTTAFCMCALLEGGAGGNSNAAANGTCSGIGAGSTYFCVKNQQ